MSTENEPYERGLIGDGSFVARVPVVGAMVAVMDLSIAERNLQLERYASRAFRVGDICELVCGADESSSPGAIVPDAIYLGFARIDVAGIVLVGDTLRVAHRVAGRVVGFDTTHMPNHYNVVLHAEHPSQSGAAAQLRVHDKVEFT